MDELAARLLAILPDHKCGLWLEHNGNRNMYRTVAEELEDQDDLYDWQSDEAKQRAIDTNEMWELRYYPNTPIGFVCLAAPTLPELLSFAAAVEADDA